MKNLKVGSGRGGRGGNKNNIKLLSFKILKKTS